MIIIIRNFSWLFSQIGCLLHPKRGTRTYFLVGRKLLFYVSITVATICNFITEEKATLRLHERSKEGSRGGGGGQERNYVVLPSIRETT